MKRASPARGARLVHLSTNYVFDGAADRALRRGRPPEPPQHLRDLEARRRACRAGLRARRARRPHRRPLRPARQRVQGRNFVTRMIARAREQGALKVVADQRLTPTFTSDLAAGILAAVEAGVTGVCTSPTGRDQLARVHRGDHGAGRDRRARRGGRTTVPPGAADRPLNGVLVSAAPSAPGWRRCGPGERRSPTISSAPAWPRPLQLTNSEVDEAPGNTARRADPDRAARHRRRARLLLRDLSPRSLRRARHPRGDGAGQPLALRPGHRPRHALPDRRRRREARPLRARRDRRRRWWTSAAARRPSASGRRSSSTRTTCESVYCPVGFAHGFCVLSDVADVMYKQSNYYADATERGIAYNDPDVASSGRFRSRS